MPLKHNHGFHCIHTHQSMCVRKLVGRNLFQDAEISCYQADGVSRERLTHLISRGQLISGVNKGLIHLQIATRHLPSSSFFFLFLSLFTDGKVTNKEQINPTAEWRSIFHFQCHIYTLLNKASQ